jgi:hypothetical protein
MRYLRALLVVWPMILCLALLGCEPESSVSTSASQEIERYRPTLDECYQRWLVVTNSATAILPENICDAKNPEMFHFVEVLDVVILARGNDCALIMDSEGNPLWGGAWAEPVYAEDRIAGFVLASKFKTWDHNECIGNCFSESAMDDFDFVYLYEMAFMSLTYDGSPADIACRGIGFAQPGFSVLPASEGNQCPAVLDIDADGNSEVVLLVLPEGLNQAFGKTPVDWTWDLRVYRSGFAESGFFGEPSTGVLEGYSALVIEVEDVGGVTWMKEHFDGKPALYVNDEPFVFSLPDGPASFNPWGDSAGDFYLVRNEETFLERVDP